MSVSEDMSTYYSARDEWLIMKLCMYVGYHDANNVSNFGGDPIKLKKRLKNENVICHFVFQNNIKLPYQPKHSPSS